MIITKPTLLLDDKKCKKNIKTMFLKAQKNKIDFRPHFKTHQSLEIGWWFKELGVNKITVSSLEMANYFSSEWDDITVAFPANILEIETINRLAQKIQLTLIVESLDTVSFLKEHIKHEIGFFIKIDVGYHRTGIAPTDNQKIDKILNAVKSGNKVSFKGFLAHAGQTYNCRKKVNILKEHKKCMTILTQLKKTYIDKYPNLIVSLGDTPSCSVADDFTGIDEMRPGNFVFYDLTQNRIGASTIKQIAVAMACPIVSIHDNRNELVIYGGGVHFSKEMLENEPEGTIYGRIVEKKEDSWGDVIPRMFIKSLSQEHGIVSVPDSEISKYKIGDYLLILPIHSCMTANLMKSYKISDSKSISRL
jgi:D-serine deaminase-like pyridoxal phosphate-dependent protein